MLDENILGYHLACWVIIFSRRHYEIFFLFLPESMILHFMQIVSFGDNVHEMPDYIFWEK